VGIRHQTLLVGLAFLAGCAVFGVETARPPAPPADAQPTVTEVRAPPPGATTAEEFDTTSATDRQQALQGAGTTGRRLGVTIASLGDVAEPGIWIKTPLVGQARRGRVVDIATGNAVALDLVPLDAPAGSGSRLSLAAMRLLGTGLTDLPELEVYALAQ